MAKRTIRRIVRRTIRRIMEFDMMEWNPSIKGFIWFIVGFFTCYGWLVLNSMY